MEINKGREPKERETNSQLLHDQFDLKFCNYMGSKTMEGYTNYSPQIIRRQCQT